MSRTFASLDGLMRLSRSGGVDIRPALLRVITDLFVQGATHTREEIQQYAELSQRLLPFVDEKTRAAVIAKLESFPGTPVWVLVQARAFIEKAASAPEPAAHAAARAPAESAELDAFFWDVHKEIMPASEPLAHAAELGHDAPATAGAAAATPSGRSLGDRFLRADARDRLAMLLQPSETVQASPVEAPLRFPAPTIGRLEAAARDRDQRRFARELQHAFSFTSRIAGEIAHDDGGEPLLVIGKAMTMPSDSMLRILLLLNPAVGQSVETVFRLYRLYSAVEPSTAAHIAASWREDSAARPRAQFQSVHADDAPARPRVWDGFRTTAPSRTDQAAARPRSVETPAKSQGTS